MRAWAACLCAAVLLAAGQEPPLLRVTTRLVQLNVVVHDKKGRPVADLTKDDFTLFDEGQRQKIAFFSVESTRPAAAPANVLPPNYFSNRLEYRSGAPSSVTAILFDALNTAWEDQVYSKNQLVKFLSQVQPQDRFALYVLGRDLRVLHDFTTDTRSLLRVLARHRSAPSPELEASEPAPADTGVEELDAWLNQSSQLLADFLKVNRARHTMDAIEAIARHLARVPGRKNLIWISAGFPFCIGGPGGARFSAQNQPLEGVHRGGPAHRDPREPGRALGGNARHAIRATGARWPQPPRPQGYCHPSAA